MPHNLSLGCLKYFSILFGSFCSLRLCEMTFVFNSFPLRAGSPECTAAFISQLRYSSGFNSPVNTRAGRTPQSHLYAHSAILLRVCYGAFWDCPQSERPSAGILNQSAHKLDEKICSHGISVYHEPRLTPIRNGWNHTNVFSVGIKPSYRCLSLWCIAPAGAFVISHPGFVATMNLCPLRLCLLDNTRIFFFQPRINCLSVLLIRPLRWLLWRKTPPLQIFPYRPYRHCDLKLLLYQLLYRLPCP